jgi:methyl-accepting chemotaxis protein
MSAPRRLIVRGAHGNIEYTIARVQEFVDQIVDEQLRAATTQMLLDADTHALDVDDIDAALDAMQASTETWRAALHAELSARLRDRT